jgi:hypothetical protein
MFHSSLSKLNKNKLLNYIKHSLPKQLVAKVASELTFNFDKETYFPQIKQVMNQLFKIIDLSFPSLLEQFSFYCKIELNYVLVNIEDGSTMTKSYSIPSDHTFLVRNEKDIENCKKMIESFLNSFLESDSVLPNTKWRIHEFLHFKIKIAKAQHGGCKNYVADIQLKKKKCLLNPDNKDNLCFWRCLAIALNENIDKSIVKKNSKSQRIKALELREDYEKNSKRESVLLADLPNICEILKLNISVYSLNEGKIISLFSSQIKAEPEILLHLDTEKIISC